MLNQRSHADPRPGRGKLNQVALLCVEFGSGLLESGAETSRVEEAVQYLAAAFGIEAQSMVTPTGITVSVGEQEPVTRVVRIHSRTVDLCKVARLNTLSRQLLLTGAGPGSTRREVARIRSAPQEFSERARQFATAVAAACFTALAGGGSMEIVAGFGAGLLVQLLLERLQPRFPSFLRLFFGAFAVTAAGGLAAPLGLTASKIVVGALMPQMPGLALVASARDLMAGELVAGLARGAEALLVASAMGAGVVAGLSLNQSWSGVPGVVGI